jgi:hypothetical protein
VAAAVSWSNTMGRRAFCFAINASFLVRLSRKIRTLIWLTQASAVRRNKKADGYFAKPAITGCAIAATQESVQSIARAAL